ncbi:uncharacterized protein DSM5745_09664 [Aspergillus mulundensis]|uniref:Uncharacterized protein n=1 Tax=Aspergillus mulundensis TaxID=1810919 RepID=A0A3D8QVX7_9EURO|nr:hypothetical protein DSM5745_09664 [Aspergillus mulundensis]RDW65925.1 hypothetical protein DSM5745_09664 [Aspergillus mulundensis]
MLFTLMSSCTSSGVMKATYALVRHHAFWPHRHGGLGVDEPVTTQGTKGVISLMVVFGKTALCDCAITSRLGFAINVCFNFAVNFSGPYLVFEDGAGLESRVGFIFGAVAFLQRPDAGTGRLLFSNGVRLRDFGKAEASRMLDGGAGGSKDNDIEACSAKASVPP